LPACRRRTAAKFAYRDQHFDRSAQPGTGRLRAAFGQAKKSVTMLAQEYFIRRS